MTKRSQENQSHTVATCQASSTIHEYRHWLRPASATASATSVGHRYHPSVKPRILVVEDEQTISEPLAEGLERDGFETEVAATLEQARAAFGKQPPDLILLDVMLPDGDGRDLAKEIRRDSDVPIVMLTARGEEIDRVLGLELGADDYVVKPFSSRELTARIHAILRRGRSTDRKRPIEIGDLRLDPASRTCTKAGEPVELARVRPPADAHGQRRRRGPARGDHGRGVGPALVRPDEDAGRAHLVAPEEDRGRPLEAHVHHHDPGRRVPVPLAAGDMRRRPRRSARTSSSRSPTSWSSC